MMFALSDLISKKTRDEILTSILDVATSLGLKVTSWQSGGVVRTILTLFSQKVSDFTTVIVEPIKGGFGDLLSSDEWADQWAKGQFDVDRVQAAAATGTVTATNTEATPHALNPGALLLAHAVTGKTYRNQDTITIPANDVLEDIAIAADELGTASNAAPDTITVIVSPGMIGVTVTNPEPVLGADKEITTALVSRARAKLEALSPLGPKHVYDYIAKTPEFSATSTPITRTNTVPDEATGELTCYLATADGAPTGGDVDIVQAAFDDWAEPWCVTSTAAAATPVTVDVDYIAWLRGNTSTADEVKDTIATALAVYFAEIPLGGEVIPPSTGKVYQSTLAIRIGNAVVGTVRVQVNTADTSIDEDEIPVLGTVTGVVNFL